MSAQRWERETAGNGTGHRFKVVPPAYAAYIPQRMYQAGCTFGKDTAECMDKFCEATQKATENKENRRVTTVSIPKLKPIRSDPVVMYVLEEYRQKQASSSCPMGSKRSMLEPPKVGWTGYVPKSKVTELGLGVSYHTMSGQCFEAFNSSINKHPRLSSIQKHKDDFNAVNTSDRPGYRLYRPEGMMPKYTGYIPHKCFVYGMTYGNMCRANSVCNHHEKSYGDHSSKKLSSQSEHN